MLLIFILAAVLFGAGCGAPNAELISDSSAIAQTNDDKKTEDKKTPVIVELFTSEGCSSCPPADKLLAILNRDQIVENAEIIALSQHVDYWDRLGWRDPFSSRQFSNRQDEYAGFFKKDEVYTPQMVVDGRREFNGADAALARKSIIEAAKEKKGDATIEIEKLENNVAQLEIKIENLPRLSKNDVATAMLAVTEDNLLSKIYRGENSGRRLQHVAVVRSLQNIGNLTQDGKSFAQTFVIDSAWKLENLNAVVFVQETGSRKILAAAKIKLQN